MMQIFTDFSSKVFSLQCVLWLLILMTQADAEAEVQKEQGDTVQVINFNPKEGEYEKSYNQTGSWAKLENVTNFRLGKSFTICSALARERRDLGQVCFTLLGEDERAYLSALIYDGSPYNLKSHLHYKIGNHYWKPDPPKGFLIPIVYPDEWVHSCMALSIDANSLQMQWVVNGLAVVENITVEIEEGNEAHQLEGRMILGKPSNHISQNIHLS